MEFSIKEIYFFHSSRKCKCQLQNKKEKDKEIKNKAAKKENQKNQFKDNWRTLDLLSSSASSSYPHLPHWSKSIVYKNITEERSPGETTAKENRTHVYHPEAEKAQFSMETNPLFLVGQCSLLAIFPT